jgi:hypothetical protein
MPDGLAAVNGGHFLTIEIDAPTPASMMCDLWTKINFPPTRLLQVYIIGEVHMFSGGV